METKRKEGFKLSFLISLLLLLTLGFLSALVYAWMQIFVWGLFGDGYREPNLLIKLLFVVFPIVIASLPILIYLQKGKN